MKKKERIHLTIFIMAIATIFSLFFTATFARILAGVSDKIEILNPITCIIGLFTVKGQGMMFLAFELFALLCCFAMFTSNEKGYQSELISITKDIETPAPTGQNQHGSARWLQENEKDEVFNWEILDREDKIVKYLVESGYDSLDFMKVKQKTKIPKNTNNGGDDLFKLFTKGGIVVGRKLPQKSSPKDNSKEKIHFITPRI